MIEMKALLAHRGVLVHVDHSHRLSGWGRADAGLCRGHVEMRTASPSILQLKLHNVILKNLASESKQNCTTVNRFCAR